MNAIDIAPCFRCEHEASVRVFRVPRAHPGQVTTRWRAYVECGHCGNKGPESSACVSHEDATKEAIRHWDSAGFASDVQAISEPLEPDHEA
jgi:hypothetical protein